MDNKTALAPQSSAGSKISLISQRSLPEGMGLALSRLLADAMAYKPNQALSDATQEVFLSEWEEMTLKHGLETFRDALLKALRESAFFPDPSVIRVHCEAIHLRKFDDAERKRKNDEYEAKQQHMREHPEEYVTGVKL